MEYTYLKGRGIINGKLTRGTFALSSDHRGLNPSTSFRFCFKGEHDVAINAVSFIFGFSGVGRHYRLEIDFNFSSLALFLIRDGIKVYLHHIRCLFNTETRFELYWLPFYIELCIDGKPVLRVFDDELKAGRWGFFADAAEFPIPSVEINEEIRAQFEWLVLGDGFSNARWRERSFISWPEILFNQPLQCANLAVAAGNSQRTVEIVRKIPDGLAGNVILAAGNDDLIEGSGFTGLTENLTRCVSLLRNLNRVFVCSLTPRSKSMNEIKKWNEELRLFVESHSNWEFLDIYKILLSHFESGISLGEFPNNLGQELIAKEISKKLGLRYQADNAQLSAPIKSAGLSFVYKTFFRVLSSVNARSGRLLRRMAK